ncbi:MAG: beta-galactosidase [Verrucomicrobiae bacterium]|nr:beta-galactosidase [Verrucomicrobiae bacterium]
MKKLILAGWIFAVATGMAVDCPVEQKDWRDYFPGIPLHPSMYEPEYGMFDVSYVTPHTPWAKPYCAGKVKTLIIMPRVALRDAVELAQRADLDVDVFGAFSRQSFGCLDVGRYEMPVGYTEADQLILLNGKLKKNIDVLVVGHVYWDAFPREIQKQLMERVKGGMGLTLVFDGAEEIYAPSELKALPAVAGAVGTIAQGVPFSVLDGWNGSKTDSEAAGKILSCKEYGRGRVAIVKCGSGTAHSCFAPTVYRPEIKLWPVDYYFSLAARAVLWAAGKAPQGDLQCAVEGRTLKINFGGAAAGEFSVKVRDDWGEEVFNAKGGKTQYELPDLAAGQYVADVVARKDGKVLNWGSAAFRVNKETVIKGLEMDALFLKPGEPLKFKAALNGAAKKGLELKVKVWDMRERLLSETRQEVKAGEAQVSVSAPANRPLTNMVYARVWLMDGGNEQSHAQAWMPVQLSPPRDDFGFVNWHLSSPDYVSYYLRRELLKLGVDSSYGGRSYSQAWVPATSGIFCIPYLTRYAIDKSSGGLCPERIPCLSDPDFVSKEQAKIKKGTEEMSRFGTAGYSLGDENDLSLNDHEVCFSKSCKAAFREYVKGVYGSLEALNREWGTALGSWEEAGPLPLCEAREKKQPARWVDFRMSMENVFLNLHKTGAATIKGVDPKALVGFDGGFNISSFTGYDWWKLSRIMEVWGVYPDHLQSEILRSFHLPETRSGRWYGGYYNITRFKEYAKWEPWYGLFHEMNNVWWFNLIGGDSQSGPQAEDTFNPATMKPFPILKAASDEALVLKRGVGKLLMGCRRDAGGIAILYSQASLHAATYHGMRHNPNDSQTDFIRALEDMGYQYRFVSYDQVKEGILKREKYRLLILPCAVALSGEEKEQIKAFAAAGGKVLADDKTGVYDGHGKPAADTAWAEWSNERVTHLGPALRGYHRDIHFAASARVCLAERLAALGIAPEFSIAPEEGDAYEGELAVFTDGETRYVGLLRDHSPKLKTQKARIKFPQAAYVYDVRAGKYLGRSDNLRVNPGAGEAGLWALLPEEARGLELETVAEAKAGGEVSYKVALAARGRHVARVEVMGPDGAPRPHYGANLTLKQGKAEGTIPLAINDSPGKWTIQVRDVATGLKTSRTVVVK